MKGPPSVVLAGSFFLFAFLFLSAPVIPDSDSYYHLAVAREYATGGLMDTLPWARFSILGETFGDKELLFHALLAPFTLADAASGGRLALALLNATVAATVTIFATRAFGWWSLVVPLWLYAAAPMLTFRLIRLRPELLALLLLLALIHMAAERRYLGLGVLAAIFALSYTAFHVVIGLSILFFLFTFKEREWKLPLAAVAGVATGLVVHPGFPGNLTVWWTQNALFFLEKSRLDVGTEIEAPTLEFLFARNLGWWAGAVLLVVVTRGARTNRRIAFFGIASAVFALLTVFMERMAVYFIPLLTIVLLERMATQPPRRIGRTALALLATAFLSAPGTLQIYRELVQGSGVDLTYERDYAEMSERIPSGAKVAAHWGPTGFYTFWAPQGRYLNVLDPVFMAVPHRAVYDAQRRLFEANDPDVPSTMKHTLDSDYLAFPATAPLFERVQHDPRIAAQYVGFSFVGRVAPEEARRFVREWRLPDGSAYPMKASPAAYIEASRVSPCVVFVHEERVQEAVARVYELTSQGPAELRIGEAFRAANRGSNAILGRGTMVRVTLAPGPHRFVVKSCAAAGSGLNGFYLLVRRERPATL